jgi:DNA-binding MarR family transcriptional regulator
VEATATKPTAADRELASRFGAVMLRCLHADDGAALRAIDESGLTFTQMKALFSLAAEREEPHTLSSLAAGLGLSDPAASRAVEGLVKRGFVARTEDDRDRRVRRLAPTTAGRRLADGIQAARLEGIGQFVATLSEAEREKLDEALELLLAREEIAAVYRKYRRGARR